METKKSKKFNIGKKYFLFSKNLSGNSNFFYEKVLKQYNKKKRKKEKNFDYSHGNKVWQSLIGTVKGHYLTEHINC